MDFTAAGLAYILPGTVERIFILHPLYSSCYSVLVFLTMHGLSDLGTWNLNTVFEKMLLYFHMYKSFCLGVCVPCGCSAYAG